MLLARKHHGASRLMNARLVSRKPGVLHPGSVEIRGQRSYDHGMENHEYTPPSPSCPRPVYVTTGKDDDVSHEYVIQYHGDEHCWTPLTNNLNQQVHLSAGSHHKPLRADCVTCQSSCRGRMRGPSAHEGAAITSLQLFENIRPGYFLLHPVTSGLSPYAKHRLIPLRFPSSPVRGMLSVEQVPYPFPVTLVDFALAELTANTEVAEIRDQYNADLVQLVGYLDDSCGIG